MASSLRNGRLRALHRALSNYGLRSRRHSTSTSPLHNDLNGFSHYTLSGIIRRLSPPIFCPLGFQCGHGIAALQTLNCRFLCTDTASTSVNQSGGSGGSSKANTCAGDGKNSGGGSQKTSDQGKPIRGSPVSWMSFFLLLATGATLVWYYDREKKRHIEEISKASKAAKEGPSVGKPSIGGPFNLVDHNGKPVTEREFLGKWTLIYFGFTHCPDICPDELVKLAAAVDKIKEKSGLQVVPIFITVDPERDTVEQVREYVKEFHPDFIGLTGNVEEIKKAARAYRIYYMKTEEEGSDYLVDHSIIMYLMDPKMEFVKFFGKNNDADSLADGVIKEWKQHQKV